MKSLRTFLLTGILVFLLFFLIFFRTEAAKFLERFNLFFAGFFDQSFNYQAFQELRLENESLKRDLGKISNVSPLFKNRFHYLEAEIYSRYPFNDKDLLVINRGFEDGLREGLPVLVEENVLFGRVRSVKRTQSEIQTIFDSSWRSSVALGENRVNALFRGGGTPSVELIPKGSTIISGDEILNLSEDYPFGISLGIVGNVKIDSSGIWQVGLVDFAYNPDALKKVLVILDFP
ncbi:MAG: rod shape-determining protein MreC [Patescibacteria group bacterium]